MTQTSNHPTAGLQVPPPPRPVTAAGRRRSWNEPGVRVFWAMAALLLVVAVIYAASRVPRINRDQQLIDNGKKILVRVDQIGERRQERWVFPDPTIKPKVKLVAAVPGSAFDPDGRGKQVRILQMKPAQGAQGPYVELQTFEEPPRKLTGYLKSQLNVTEDKTFTVIVKPEQPGQPIEWTDELLTFTGELDAQRDNNGRAVRIGDYINIIYDPADPSRWTDRTSVSMADKFLIPAVLVPAAVILLLVAFLKRRSILAVWRDQPLAEAVVVDVRSSALYPRSHVVRLTLLTDASQRVFATVIPSAYGNLAKGDTIHVVAPVSKPQQAVVAALYR